MDRSLEKLNRIHELQSDQRVSLEKLIYDANECFAFSLNAKTNTKKQYYYNKFMKIKHQIVAVTGNIEMFDKLIETQNSAVIEDVVDSENQSME